MESGTATDVAGGDAGATAEVAVGDLVVKDAAVVDLEQQVSTLLL